MEFLSQKLRGTRSASAPASLTPETDDGATAYEAAVHVAHLSLPDGITAHQCAVIPAAQSIAYFGARGIHLPQGLRAAVLKRRVEYLAGRYCSQCALHDAGYRGHSALPANEDRSPAWPQGWRGSLSHCADTAVAIVARQTDFAGLGIDIENILQESSLRPIAENVLLESEWPLLRALEVDHSTFITLGFSLKESLYKALWPQAQARLEFHDARLTDICPLTRRFAIELKVPHPRFPGLTRFEGAFLLGARHVLSTIWVPCYVADTLCDWPDKHLSC